MICSHVFIILILFTHNYYTKNMSQMVPPVGKEKKILIGCCTIEYEMCTFLD